MPDHRSRRLVSAGIVLLAAVVVWADEPAKKPADPPKSPPALPASLAGFEDAGTFHLYKSEEQLVTIEFTWKKNGSFENKSVLSLGGQTVKQSFTVTPDKDGRWEKIEVKAGSGDVTIVRKGGSVERTAKGKTETYELKPDVLLFENFAPALFSQSVRAYDQAKGGKQKRPVVVLPRALVEVTLEAKGEVERAVGGRDLKLRRYLFELGGVEITVSVGADDGKVYLADVPSQQAAYVRAGFEALRQTEEKDPLISKPTHKVKVERGIGVPMRDGVKLSTDIYRPEGDGKHPVILIRTPYKKEMQELDGMYYARRGYVVAAQDVRGRFASPGEWEPFVHEPDDGYDAIEWLAGRPWSTGKVGMVGGSYVGWVQWFAASRKPPHLATIIPNVSPPDPFYNMPYDHGVFFQWAAIWWADVLATAATADLSGAALEKTFEREYGQILRALPLIDVDKKVFGKENPVWRKWIDHPTDDDYWARIRFHDKLADVKIPVFHQSGWFDGDGIGSKLNYLAMAKHGHPYQKLVLGPWGHTDKATRSHGGHDFGPEAATDLPRAYLRWFDKWLKGVDNGIDKEPLVSLFVMNSNTWAHGPTYPLPETKFEKWYLASGGKANTSKGDGKLTRDAPAADSPPDKYTYDPGDPTPDPRFFEAPKDKDGKPLPKKEEAKKEKAYHAELTAARKDVLVYVTEPFKEEYTFAGPVSAVVYAASSAKDTDWHVRLVEVDEKGELFLLAAGKIRARFRKSMSKPELLEPDKVYEYQLDLWQTGLTVKPGGRLRVEVASAAFPLFSRNLNTGGHNEKETAFVPAKQSIFHSREHPSHVLLPVLPGFGGKKH
jgi:putative CocE/NonD family hydrolase